ncbi:MAG: TAXI family TRAP transporter solute-binding subunit [Burkholderiaceae bacterium]
MKHERSWWAFAATGLLIALTTAGVAYSQSQINHASKDSNQPPATLVSIGSGAVGGVYFPAAGALCRLLNHGVGRHGIRCVVDRSGGSVQNVEDVLARRVDFGIVQTDIQADSVRGKNHFSQRGPAGNLRALFTVHAEPFTVVSRLDAGIQGFRDLRGKRVNIGKPDSGTRATMQLVMRAYGMTRSDFADIAETDAETAGAALCENKIDAFVYVVGHPNRTLRSTSEACAIHLVNVSGEELNSIVQAYDYYAATTIAGGIYVGNRQPVTTFGVRASVLGLESVPELISYELTRAVFEGLDQLRGLHPAFSTLARDEMLLGNAAPFHAGARRYYREIGLQLTAN